MTTKEFLNAAEQGNFLIGDYMIWKHSQGWSAIKINTGQYFMNAEDWIYNRELHTDETGRNYWTDIEVLLQKLFKVE